MRNLPWCSLPFWLDRCLCRFLVESLLNVTYNNSPMTDPSGSVCGLKCAAPIHLALLYDYAPCQQIRAWTLRSPVLPFHNRFYHLNVKSYPRSLVSYKGTHPDGTRLGESAVWRAKLLFSRAYCAKIRAKSTRCDWMVVRRLMVLFLYSFDRSVCFDAQSYPRSSM